MIQNKKTINMKNFLDILAGFVFGAIIAMVVVGSVEYMFQGKAGWQVTGPLCFALLWAMNRVVKFK